MKRNIFKRPLVSILGVIAIGVVLSFGIGGCKTDSDDDTKNDYELINGGWDRGDIVVTFSNDSAVFTEINEGSGWKKVQNNGSIHIGDKKFRNIKKTGDHKWAAQERTYDPSTNLVKDWEDCTITLSSNGQALTSYIPSITDPAATYTRK